MWTSSWASTPSSSTRPSGLLEPAGHHQGGRLRVAARGPWRSGTSLVDDADGRAVEPHGGAQAVDQVVQPRVVVLGSSATHRVTPAPGPEPRRQIQAADPRVTTTSTSTPTERQAHDDGHDDPSSTPTTAPGARHEQQRLAPVGGGRRLLGQVGGAVDPDAAGDGDGRVRRVRVALRRRAAPRPWPCRLPPCPDGRRLPDRPDRDRPPPPRLPPCPPTADRRPCRAARPWPDRPPPGRSHPSGPTRAAARPPPAPRRRRFPEPPPDPAAPTGRPTGRRRRPRGGRRPPDPVRRMLLVVREVSSSPEQCTAGHDRTPTMTPAVALLVALRQGVHRPAGGPLGPRLQPCPAAPDGAAGQAAVEHARPGPRPGPPGHRGRPSTAPPPAACRYPSMSLATTTRAGGHGLEQHQAEGLAPEGRGAASTSAATSRRSFSSSSDHAQPLHRWPTRGAGAAGRPSPARRRPPTAPGRPPPARNCAPPAAQASSSTASPLRSSWRPRNRTVGPSVGHGPTPSNRSTSIPLNNTSNGPPSAAGRGGRRRPPTPRTRTASRRASGRVTGGQQRVERRCPRCGGRSRPAAATSRAGQQGVGQSRGEGLVDVHDVGPSPGARRRARAAARATAPPAPPSRWPAATTTGRRRRSRPARRVRRPGRPGRTPSPRGPAGRGCGRGRAPGPGRRRAATGCRGRPGRPAGPRARDGPCHRPGQSVMERRWRRRLHLTPYMASSARLSSFDGSVSGSSTKTPPTEASATRVRPSIR